MLDDILVLTVNENKNFTFDSAFLESSQCGNNEAVQFLLDLGVNINYSNSEGKTALMLACEGGHEEVVQTLVEYNNDLNFRNCGIIDLALKRSLLKHNHFVFILKYRIAVYLTYNIRATIIGQTYKILQPLQQYTTTITTI